ncbi:Fe-S-containing protein [Thermodesulfobacteriota bacterium]
MSRKKRDTRNQDKRSVKKAAVLGTERKRQAPLIIFFVCTVLILTGGIAFYSLSGKKASATAPATAAPNATAVDFPTALFNDGIAHHFAYQHNDITIRYFVLKSSDGVIRAAFDACDVCWPAGKGYYQEGDDMVCRNCGRRFASVLVNEVKGGCNPAPLTRGIVGDKLVIHNSDILEGKQYFDFSGRT